MKLGYKMVKYLTEVNFLPAATGGYWEDQGYEWFAGRVALSYLPPCRSDRRA